MDTKLRPTFDVDQIQHYLKYIELPEHFGYESPKDIAFLIALHIHQISKVPYENLSLHYSSSHEVNLDPQFMYNKITSGTGRGGYCMEISIFYSHLLRSLGFNVYTTGARNRDRIDGVPSGPYNPLVHMVNIVTFEDGSRYVVDVAFGGDGPTLPMPLVANKVQTNLGFQEVQYAYEAIPQFNSDYRFWIYQYRNGKDRNWNAYYSFSECPFIDRDYDVMSPFASQQPNQAHRLLVVSFLRENNRIVGKRYLVGGVIKENMGGKTVLIKQCVTETERIEALQNYFGMSLSEEEKNSISGLPSELIDPLKSL